MNSNKLYMRGVILIYSFLWCTTQLNSQPYVDPIQVRYMYAFRNDKSPATPFTHLWAGSDLPVKLKENTYLLLSPFYEQWQIDSADNEKIYPVVKSFAFPAGLMLPLNSKWSVTVIPTFRWNGEKLFEKRSFQFGAAGFASYARKPDQKFRLGVYVNDEFFGLFVIPLVGTDWRMSERNHLFGILPGRLSFEHRWTSKLYGGATFRALTNSYLLSNGQYLRLDDNQLSAYLDFYLAKHICLTLEPGYGLVRKIRTGIHNRDYLTSYKWGNGPFVKLSAAYRIRL